MSHDAGYFHEMYAGSDDPWGFDERWYEKRKYDLTMAALPRETFRRAVEPGCANGALTERLADRCDELIAFDLVTAAVERARSRLAGRTHVEVREAEYPTWWPAGTGDLVVWSEVGYYLTDDGFAVAVDGLRRWLEPDGVLIAVHYTGETDYPRSGQDVARRLDTLTWLRRTTTLVDEQFELGVWHRSVT